MKKQSTDDIGCETFAVESSTPAPSSPAVRLPDYTHFQTSTPNYLKKTHQPLNVVLSSSAPSSPPVYGEPTLTPPPRSPGAPLSTPASGDRAQLPDGTSSDKSSETAVGVSRNSSTALSRKESYKAQRQHYRKEKKRAATALLHSIEDPSVVVLADWLKVRGSLKSWTKLWCVLKPGLLLLYKSPKAKRSHWVGTVLLTSCQVIERPSKKDGFCFKLYHPLEQSIWAPRGPHNETIGAVVQPLPTAHLIFRAPSQAAGHCWLDGLELALRCSNAMLRCSRSRPEQTVEADAPSTQTNISHEELEKHFNEHDVLIPNVSAELAGAASDTDSEASRQGMPVVSLSADPLARKREVLSRIESLYVEDPDREIGVAGELVEEVAEENKSLLWFLLKQVRPGMDLSKVVLPTFILEPRSFLDKLSDNYYHADLLGQAQILEDPYQRFKGVLRWYLSGLYRKPKGLKKPYNPVLGETFRCCWRHKNDTYTYYIAEQVSHHPPVSAFYVSNRKDGFVIEGSLLARSKFYGNSTSAILEGCARIHLLNWGETYITTAPYAHCKGIVIGTLSMELGGKVHIICQETGYQADVEFKLRSFLGGADQTNAISGRIKRGKDTIATVEGYWDGRIDIKDKKTGDETSLLDVSVLKEQRLPRYLVDVDKQHEWESQRLWIKVSEAILSEDQVLATEQKTIIEEAQRARARNLLTAWTPRLFHSDSRAVPPEGIIDQGWRYNHTDTSPWQPEEIIEYEDDFIITSIKTGASMGPSNEARLREMSHRASDSESHDDLARRSKTSTRTLKQTLHSIDSTLREQSIAIERLTKNVEMLNEGQRAAAFHPQNVARIPTASHSWDLFGGFVLAMVLQALLNWIFHQREQRD
ncbi:oxysterol-binding protein-related protein 8 isoform X1 [Pieris rapae]|uniref:oxysterol-binding protein-related protein 8 isoform X1 n=1 Tax=Pieris rapae TaxID=64459 RepID=UPI001E27A5D7|nr:oxysterol-binding protein-related protein 8 isoform X1 [Pieris rapae]XP_045489200.1 oxysterol-binding protein-related protein 8 isoform X1 [Pieris rapae]